MILLSKCFFVLVNVLFTPKLTKVFPTHRTESAKEVNHAVGQASGSTWDKRLMELVTQCVKENEYQGPDHPAWPKHTPMLAFETTQNEPSQYKVLAPVSQLPDCMMNAFL